MWFEVVVEMRVWNTNLLVIQEDVWPPDGVPGQADNLQATISGWIPLQFVVDPSLWPHQKRNQHKTTLSKKSQFNKEIFRAKHIATPEHERARNDVMFNKSPWRHSSMPVLLAECPEGLQNNIVHVCTAYIASYSQNDLRTTHSTVYIIILIPRRAWERLRNSCVRN